jgi:outer membrane protein assembly factor BamB
MSKERGFRHEVGAALAGLVGLIAGSVLACWPKVHPTALPGCGKDTDCKGTRICVRGACVDPRLAPSDDDGGQPPLAATAGLDASSPATATDAAPRETITLALEGASPMLHVTWNHSGRSPYRLPIGQPSEVARIRAGGVVISSPAIASDGTAYFGAHDRSVRAISPLGKPLWQHMTGDLVWCSPALGHDGVVYVGSDDDHLYALDTADGHERFSFTAGPCRHTTGPGPQASRCDVDGVTVGPDGNVYFVADGIYGLRPDGSLIFRFALGVHCAGAPAIGPDRTIYAGCQDGALYALTPDGQKRWEYRTGDDVDSPPAVGNDGTVYFGSDDTRLYAVDPSGALQWALKTDGPVRGSPALGEGGLIYIGSYDGRLYAVRQNGTVAWTFRAADRIHSSPLVDASGAIAVGSQDDRLYAIEADGRLRWSVLLGGDVDGTPALGADGTLYVGADNGVLYMLK